MLATIGIAIITEAIFYTANVMSVRNNSTLMINQLLDTVEYTLAIAAYTNNEQIAKEVSVGLMRNTTIKKVKIQGDQGLLIETNKDQISDINIEIKRNLISPFDRQQIIGSVSIAPYADFTLEETIPNPTLILIKVLALISLATVIVLRTIRRNILQNLDIISNIIKKNISGEHHIIAPLNNHTCSELNQLVTDINALLEQLEKQKNKEIALNENIQHLEHQFDMNSKKHINSIDTNIDSPDRS